MGRHVDGHRRLSVLLTGAEERVPDREQALDPIALDARRFRERIAVPHGCGRVAFARAERIAEDAHAMDEERARVRRDDAQPGVLDAGHLLDATRS
jgi:hypothetical protein